MINVALIFPGQGAQAVGMGKEFYDSSKEARQIFNDANRIVKGLTDVIFNGPPEKLTSTAYCQPAIFTYSIAALEALKVHPQYQKFNPQFTAGLSLGECTAVAASGALSFEEALKLVERRSFYMEEATNAKKGAMSAIIGLDREKIVEICEEHGAEVANFNSPDQTVITGEADKVKRCGEIIKEKEIGRVIPLDVSGAFHSSLMLMAVPKFEEELSKSDFNTAQISVVSNVNGQPANASEDIRENLARQITSSVQWVKSIEYMASQGIKDFLEIGPGTVLKGLIRKINRELKVYNIRTPEDLQKLPL